MKKSPVSSSENKAYAAIALLAVLTPVYRTLVNARVPLLLLETRFIIAMMIVIAVLLGLVLYRSGQRVRLLVLALIFFVSLDLAGAYSAWFNLVGLDGRIGEGIRVPAKGIAFLLIFGAIYAGLWVIRGYAVRIAVVYFAVVGLATLITEPLPRLMSRTSVTVSPSAAVEAAGDSPPLIIHLLFDGLLAPGAIEPDVEGGRAVYEAMRGLAARHGFRVFERAFSRHHDTGASIPNMMNAEYLEKKAELSLEINYDLEENAYFDDYAARGYVIKVYQPSMMDYCSHKNVSVCAEFDSYNPEWMATSRFLEDDGAGAFPTLTERTSRLLFGLLRVHVRNYTGLFLARLMRGLPLLESWDSPERMPIIRYDPLGFSEWFDAFVDDVMDSDRGTLLFAHFFVPHDPHVLTSRCELTRAGGGQSIRLAGGDHHDLDRPIEGNEAILARYYAQVRCVFLKLEEMLYRIDRSDRHREALIIVHGDHGSRISIKPASDGFGTDFVARYATFFAVRSPARVPAGNDCEMASLPDLFVRYVKPGHERAAEVRGNRIIFARMGWASDAPQAGWVMPEFACFHEDASR